MIDTGVATRRATSGVTILNRLASLGTKATLKHLPDRFTPPFVFIMSRCVIGPRVHPREHESGLWESVRSKNKVRRISENYYHARRVVASCNRGRGDKISRFSPFFFISGKRNSINI